VLATVKKALFTFLREHYTVEVGDGQVLEARGDITNHEYEIHSDGEIVASISKRWFTLRDTYGVAVGPGQDDVLLLAVAVCIDERSRRAPQGWPAGQACPVLPPPRGAIKPSSLRSLPRGGVR